MAWLLVDWEREERWRQRAAWGKRQQAARSPWFGIGNRETMRLGDVRVKDAEFVFGSWFEQGVRASCHHGIRVRALFVGRG